ncbi:MAG: hypothetical protein M3S32_05920 [Acidobacteriota bacterium]|nr:hypothetical protein [Acidobacteriota bacterium]
MKLRPGSLAACLLLVSGTGLGATVASSTPVTGATNPATTAVPYGVLPNTILEIIGVVPVVSTVTGNPASIGASVNVGTSGPFNLCGAGSGTCSNDVWAAQWTIVSAPTGIQAVNAYQGTSIKLVNNTAGGTFVTLRCQVGLMTGSCIFVARFFPTTDPLF